jgi:glycosyltransferase involved in cell wall biosynthesis
MKRVIFGDPFFYERTKRACGGNFVDLELDELEPINTLFIESGTALGCVSDWSTSSAVRVVGASLDELPWVEHIQWPLTTPMPRPRVFFLSAAAIERLNHLRASLPFWSAFSNLDVRTWIDPQLRNWFHGRLRVLQVVTTLQIGGAERVCADLARMPECLGIVTWMSPARTEIRKPSWDLSSIPFKDKSSALVNLAKRLHVDVVHTHLLTAHENQEIATHFPLITTIHNSPEGWPRGYNELRPGLLVGCSSSVARALGKGARTAWNGVQMELCEAPQGQSEKEIVLVSIANFRTQKQLHLFPGIVRELRDMGFAAKLRLVGEVHRSSIDARYCYDLFLSEVLKHRVSDYVEVVQTLDVRPIFASANVFVSTSKYEGLSLAQLEALAAGLPIVATEVASGKELRDAVEAEAYISVPVTASARAFAEAIVSVARLPRRNRLPLQFSAESMASRYRWLYHAALARGERTSEVWLATNNFSMGGAQTSAKRLLRRLAEQRTVRAFTLQEQTPTQGTRELVTHGIPVHNLLGDNPKARVLSLLRRCVVSRPATLFFWNVMAHEKSLIADALSADIIDVSPGEMYFDEMGRYLARPYPELPIRRPSDYGDLLHAVVVKYSREVERMRAFVGKLPHVIPNGVEGIPYTQRSFDRDLVFGTAARIAPHKRIQDIVEAFSQLPCKLVIAGKIEKGAEGYAEELKKRSHGKIEWIGEQRITDFLPKIDVFVMVSEPAGCPNASLEAMCSGLPVILTDVGGANEQVVHGRNGWLVAPRDPLAIRAAVREALSLSSAELRSMSQSSYEESKRFSIEHMVERYVSLLIGESSRGRQSPLDVWDRHS